MLNNSFILYKKESLGLVYIFFVKDSEKLAIIIDSRQIFHQHNSFKSKFNRTKKINMFFGCQLG